MANKKSNVIEERRIQLESFLNELAKVLNTKLSII
jgi:hypothetical protein